MKKIILLITLFVCSAIQMTAQNQIAVYIVGDASESYKKVVAAAVTQAINRDGYFQAVERTGDFLNALGNEVSYQSSGAVSQSRIIELGRQFGAQYVFAVDLNNVLGELYASSRIINVSRNVVESASDESSAVANMDQLRAFAKKIADSTLSEMPYNKQKKQNADREKYLQQQRNFVNNYQARTVYGLSELYKGYKEYSNLSKDTALKYVQACKDLNVSVRYPLFYATELVSKGQPYKYGKSGKRQSVKIKAYFINSSGQALSSTYNMEIDLTHWDLPTNSMNIGGSYLHR